jgi:hypothetical protein
LDPGSGFASSAGEAYLPVVTSRRLVQLFVLLALTLAPFGRIGASQAMAGPGAMAMPAHCAGQPMPDGDKGHRMAVDCMIACAAMAPAPASFTLPLPPLAAAPVPLLMSHLAGIRPEADPPPPRTA